MCLHRRRGSVTTKNNNDYDKYCERYEVKGELWLTRILLLYGDVWQNREGRKKRVVG
jgi:hypothetical protein